MEAETKATETINFNKLGSRKRTYAHLIQKTCQSSLLILDIVSHGDFSWTIFALILVIFLPRVVNGSSMVASLTLFAFNDVCLDFQVTLIGFSIIFLVLKLLIVISVVVSS